MCVVGGLVPSERGGASGAGVAGVEHLAGRRPAGCPATHAHISRTSIKEPVYAPHLDNVERICNWLGSGIFREHLTDNPIHKQEQLCGESCPTRPKRKSKSF